MPLFSFGRFFSNAASGTRSLLDSETGLLILPRHGHGHHSAIPAKEVTKVALKLKYLYDLSSLVGIIYMLKLRNTDLCFASKD